MSLGVNVQRCRTAQRTAHKALRMIHAARDAPRSRAGCTLKSVASALLLVSLIKSPKLVPSFARRLSSSSRTPQSVESAWRPRPPWVVQDTWLYPRPGAQIYNIHCANPANAGDMNSAPVRYWDELFVRVRGAFRADTRIIDINRLAPDPFGEGTDRKGRCRIPDDSLIIVGGGGLVSHKNFHRYMTVFARRAQTHGRIVFWGVGLNGYSDKAIHATRPELPEYLLKMVRSKRALLGLRDFGGLHKPGIPWVPCVSCVHPAFDAEIRCMTDDGAVRCDHLVEDGRAEKVGILTSTVPEGNQVKEHVPEWIRSGLITRNDVHSNHGEDLQPIVDFLRRYDVIITSSYHAAYWSTLLGKKVIICKIWSDKLLWMKHPPTLYSGDIRKDIANAQRFPNALEESRLATYRFAELVMEFFQNTSTRSVFPRRRGTSARRKVRL